MSTRRSQRSAVVKVAKAFTDDACDRPTRQRRTASGNVATAIVSRSPLASSSRSPQSIRLTVKTSSSKLREVTRASSSGNSISVSSRDPFAGGEIIEGKRARNVIKSYVLESDSDEEEDEEMEDAANDDDEDDDDDDDDAEGELVEEEDGEMDADDDGLGDEDAEGDVDMDVQPPPMIKISKVQPSKQASIARASSKADHMSMDKKEIAVASDDEELSDLDSDLDEEEVDEEDAMQSGDDEDAGEGGEEDIEVEDVENDEDDLDSDETPGGSRASTPDINKMTKRQRARLEDGGSGHLLALPDGEILRYIRQHY